jgi:hypothetical protein
MRTQADVIRGPYRFVYAVPETAAEQEEELSRLSGGARRCNVLRLGVCAAGARNDVHAVVGIAHRTRDAPRLKQLLNGSCGVPLPFAIS